MKKKLLFGVILAFAIFLRLPFIFQVPPSLNWDEVSLGYNSYSILKTGKDEWARSFPLTFEAYGDYKLPGYIYMLVPFIALFGLNDFSVRLLSQIAGVIAVILVYFISKQILKDEKASLIGMFLLAVSPWHVFLSRAALEANLAFSLFLGGLFLFLKGFEKKSLFTFSAVLFGLTIFTYNSARVFVPAFLFLLLIFYSKELLKIKKALIIPLIVLSIFLITAGILAVFQDSSSRYYWVSIVDQGAISYLEESRNNSPLPEVITKLVFNKYTYFIQAFVKNYLAHFSLEFLFLKGGTNQQFSVPNLGILYLFELPILVLGLINLFKQKKGKILLIWLLLAPIPSAITREAPHVLRSIFMLGAIQLISAYGSIVLIDYFKSFKSKFRTIVGITAALIVAFFIGLYFTNYFLIYPKKYSHAWQYGYKQAVEYAENNKDKYPKIYFSKAYGEAHMFYLFYTKYDPAKYQSNPTLVRYSHTNWRWVDRLDNIYFINDWEIKEKLENEKGALLITSPKNYPKDAQVIDSIYLLDGRKAYDVVKL